ncbi:putative amidase domain protein [compost metagenome]
MSEQHDGLSEPRLSPSIPYINYSILNYGETLPRKITYDRVKAVQYAETWWNGFNPKYLEFEVDCTNFVSQCLFAGGAPMDYTGKRELGWWYAGKQGGQELWSFSWAVAHSLQIFTSTSRRGLRGVPVERPQELQPGDIISYDWDGDGRFQHNTIVTLMDANGMPLVNAHTYAARHRYWDYRDSPAWTERTRYSFIRISDEM